MQNSYHLLALKMYLFLSLPQILINTYTHTHKHIYSFSLVHSLCVPSYLIIIQLNNINLLSYLSVYFLMSSLIPAFLLKVDLAVFSYIVEFTSLAIICILLVSPVLRGYLVRHHLSSHIRTAHYVHIICSTTYILCLYRCGIFGLVSI